MKWKMVILAAAAVVCASCGIYPRYSRPDVDATLVEDDIQTPSWRDMYTDPLLQDLIGTALANSPSVGAARAKVEEAQAALQKARLQFLPSLSGNGSGDLTSGEYGAGLNASWQIDLFGKQRNAALGAGAALEGSKAYEQAVMSALIASVAQSYYSLLLLDSQLEISLKTLDNWDKTITVLESLKAAGKTNSIAILQAKAKRMNLESSSIGLRGGIEIAENGLRTLCGIQAGEIVRGRLDDAPELDMGFTEIPLVAVASRPDVRQAEMALAEAFYNTAAARSAFYPDLTLTGSASWASSADGIVWSAIAGMAAPIFSRGSNKAALKTAKARQEEARLTFRQAILSAGEEVNNSIARIRTYSRKLAVDAGQRDALAQAVEKIELTMRYSSTNYLEVLTAQQSLLDAELGLVGDKQSLISARIALYQALGGGVE